jgi:DHA1 family bicyclomycin/chloramphenicol resistance-like MFS transporter
MATALAMGDHPERAGTASGLLGFIQFTLASVAALVVGSAGPWSALPLALVMPVCSCAALHALRVTGRMSRNQRHLDVRSLAEADPRV